MPFVSSEESGKLPTLKQWLSQAERKALRNNTYHQVVMVYLPNKYPDTTFVTSEYRYSVKLAQPEMNAIAEYIATNGEPLVVCYDPSIKQAEVLNLSEAMARSPKLKLSDGSWDVTESGYRFDPTSPPQKKPSR